jgi:hypothetical protein
MSRAVLMSFQAILLGLSITMSSAFAAEDAVTSPPTAPVAAPAAPPQVFESARELRSLEEDVHGLKERVFRSKATLQLLKELVIEGATMGSRVAVWHVNRLGGGYNIESIQYFLDGKNIYSKVDPGGSLDDFREVKVREQTVAPGQHNLTVRLVLRGNGFGIFTYLRTLKFKATAIHPFEVDDGRITSLRVITSTEGSVGRNFYQRPHIVVEQSSAQLREE